MKMKYHKNVSSETEAYLFLERVVKEKDKESCMSVCGRKRYVYVWKERREKGSR
jgi:hypothetical protein